MKEATYVRLIRLAETLAQELKDSSCSEADNQLRVFVRTTKSNGNDAQWVPGAEMRRRWGARGVIVSHHRGHGLCYRVLHEDGVFAYYDPDELELIP